MKISVTVSSSNRTVDPFIMWNGLEDGIAKAHMLGYDGVELSISGKSEIQLKALERLLMKYDMEVSCISSGAIFSSLNLYLTHPNADIRSRALTVLYELIDFAGEFGHRLNIGRARGYYDPILPKENCEAAFIDILSRVVDKAASKNVQVLIEPVNRYEINFINTLDECANIIKWVPSDLIGMAADIFHMNIEEAGIGKTLIKHKGLVKHIHINDSNRKAPGLGHINFDEVFASLHEMNYDGWIVVEAMPYPTPEEAAERAINFLRPYVEAR